MAKKSRFALIMRDGVEVRDMEALQENFSLDQVLLYLSDGKLVTWLRDRYLDDTADAVLALDREAADFHRRLCNIFEVEYMGNQEGDMEKEKERERKTILLKEYMAEERFYHVVDQVAFDQEDLYDLLDEGEATIYLCGDRFFIPLGKRGIRYIGVNFPVAVISSKKEVDFGERGISFQDVRFDEKYAKVLSETGGRCDGIEEGKRGHACGQVSEITGIIQQFLDRASKGIGKCNPMQQLSEVTDLIVKLLAAVAKSVELETDGKPFLKGEEIGKEMAAVKDMGCPGQADVPVLAAGYPEKARGQIKHLIVDLDEWVSMFMTSALDKYEKKKIICGNTLSLYNCSAKRES